MFERRRVIPQLEVRVGDLVQQVGEATADCGGVEVTLAQLNVGHVLVSSIVTTQDTVLVVPGTKITTALRERLLNFAATIGIREPIQVLGPEAVDAAAAR